ISEWAPDIGTAFPGLRKGPNMNRSVFWIIGLLWCLAPNLGLALPTSSAAITYQDAAGNEQIYEFARGSNFHLVVRYWDGFNWNSADLGLPSGVGGISQPAAITYLDAAGNQQIYVFARAFNGPSNGHLVACYWNGFSWNWSDLGIPGIGNEVFHPAAITYVDSAGNQQIYVFVQTNSGRLYVDYWNGSTWNWANLGGPGGYQWDPT